MERKRKRKRGRKEEQPVEERKKEKQVNWKYRQVEEGANNSSRRD